MNEDRPVFKTHGNRSRYAAGCRCEPCTEAARIYQAEWRARKRAEGWVFVKGHRKQARRG